MPEIKQQISDLNSQILSGLAEQRKTQADYDAANLALEQQPQQLASVVGTKQQELQRTYSIQQASKSADIGLLQARQAALGGQLDTALNLAQRAVDLRYGPIEDDLKVKQAQIEAILPILNKQESIQAQALTAYYNQQQQDIVDEKAKAKENLNLALTLGITTQFANHNGEFFNTRTGETYSDPQSFFKVAGVSSFDDAIAKGLVANIDNSQIQDKAQIGQLKSTYWDAGINLSDSYETAVQKIKNNSAIYKKESYIAPSSSESNGSIIVPEGTDKLTSSLVNAFNGAVLGLPALSQKGAKATFTNYINQGDVEGAKDFLLTLTTQGLPTDQQNQLIGREQATNALSNIQTLLAQAKEKGADTNFFTGNLEYAVQKLGISSNPDLAYLGSLLQQQFIVYRRAMTGVAFSPTESEDYKKIFPDLTNVEKLSTAKIQALQDTFNMNNRAALSVYLGGTKNYDAIYGEPKGLILPSESQNNVENNNQTNKANNQDKGFWSKVGSFLWGAD